jgi:hypothetical protein
MFELLSFHPLLFLMVGVTVLFLHLEDPYAWGLAVLFAAFIACAPLGEGGQGNAAVRRLTTFYHLLLAALSPAIFCYFFAVFPVSSAIDRRLPKLKSVLLSISAANSVPLASVRLGGRVISSTSGFRLGKQNAAGLGNFLLRISGLRPGFCVSGVEQRPPSHSGGSPQDARCAG